MEVMQRSLSPGLGHLVRRRKKRMIAPVGGGVPGSSLSGLNRNSIRIVELSRGTVGYGFTISGQKPCLLRGIVEGSPAERSNLRPGNCLVGVNGKDVSHLAHDEVVALIGKCTGLLRLHIADTYFSESSDEELQIGSQHRQKYHSRGRGSSKSSLTKRSSASNSNEEHFDLPTTEKLLEESSPPPYANLRRPTWDPVMSSPRRVPRYGESDLGEESPVPALPSRSNRKTTNPNVESVRVFPNQEGLSDACENSSSSRVTPVIPSVSDNRAPLRVNNSKGSDCDSIQAVSNGKPSPGSHSTNSSLSTSDILPSSCSNVYQAVVGYVGSVELPAIEDRKRLSALTACVRRLRVERRMRSIVLLQIQPNGVSLFSSNQNVQRGPPLAFYSSGIISFSGAYNEDRRFFGLVTSTNPTKNCSCHVFMVEPKLLSHENHLKRARAFGIQCSSLPIPKNGQVLGLQECSEFPATADPILSAIVRIHRGEESANPAQRSPSEASTRLESTTSSNSDSGVGFRDESDRHSARIYDIIEPSLMFDVKNIRRSPVPRKRYPHSHKKTVMPAFSSSCQSCRNEYEEDARSTSDTKSVTSLPFFGSDNSSTSAFQADPLSLQEILSSTEPSFGRMRNRGQGEPQRNSFGGQKSAPPHIEVSVLVNSKNESKATDSSNELDPIKTQMTRNCTRSLDNLCSSDVLDPPEIEGKGNLGSTPALNKTLQRAEKPGNADGFWEFKVPRPPKPKKEMNRVESWAESIEKLLGDYVGREVFTEFLQHEFSAENIHFYNACVRYKEAFPNLTQSQRISLASTIFQRYLQNGASEPVNVDFQARSQVEKLLSQPTLEIFELPLSQVFNLLKFDCYPRFLRSDIYREYATGSVPLPQYEETSESDQDSVKSGKFEQDGRRRSLLPWHIKNRSKYKKKQAEAERLNSDVSFIQRTAMSQNGDSSDTDDGRRQSYKLCRIVLPDNSTTVLPCKAGETLSVVVQRLLEKREFHYSAFELINVATGKALDLTLEASEITAKEVKVEPRAFIGIELPRGWRVGVRASPFRKVSEVLKPILSQHSLKLDGVVVYDIEAEERIDMKCPMARVDGHNLLVKIKDSKLEEMTVQVAEGFSDHPLDDDDMVSTKTGSSQGSSVFRDFLRRSSKKYKRKGKPEIPPSTSHDRGLESIGVVRDGKESSDLQQRKQSSGNTVDEKSRTQTITDPSSVASPLSMVSSELRLTENSRNRKPIYVAPMSESKAES